MSRHVKLILLHLFDYLVLIAALEIVSFLLKLLVSLQSTWLDEVESGQRLAHSEHIAECKVLFHEESINILIVIDP